MLLLKYHEYTSEYLLSSLDANLREKNSYRFYFMFLLIENRIMYNIFIVRIFFKSNKNGKNKNWFVITYHYNTPSLLYQGHSRLELNINI